MSLPRICLSLLVSGSIRCVRNKVPRTLRTLRDDRLLLHSETREYIIASLSLLLCPGGTCLNVISNYESSVSFSHGKLYSTGAQTSYNSAVAQGVYEAPAREFIFRHHQSLTWLLLFVILTGKLLQSIQHQPALHLGMKT